MLFTSPRRVQPYQRMCDCALVYGKLQEVLAILGDTFPFAVTSKAVDLAELQGTPEEV